MFVHTVIMVIEPHMKQGRQHKLISTIFLATSVTKKLDHNKPSNAGGAKRIVKVKSSAPRQIQRRSFAALAITLSRKIF